MPIQNPIALYELDATKLALTGSVVWFAGLSVPAGWLIANGAELSRTVYAELFAAIGTAHGHGDGSTTFNLPDLRGEFIRGFDNNRGIDAGRLFATAQAGAIQAHSHTTPALSSLNGTQTGWAAQDATVTYESGSFSGGLVSSTGGTETRPRNIALLGLIKY
jgi:microcystin-dependent protein